MTCEGSMFRAAAAASSLFSWGLPHSRRHLLPLMISRLLRASAALSADCLLANVTKAQCFRSICIAKDKVIFRTNGKPSKQAAM